MAGVCTERLKRLNWANLFGASSYRRGKFEKTVVQFKSNGVSCARLGPMRIGRRDNFQTMESKKNMFQNVIVIY